MKTLVKIGAAMSLIAVIMTAGFYNFIQADEQLQVIIGVLQRYIFTRFYDGYILQVYRIDQKITSKGTAKKCCS